MGAKALLMNSLSSLIQNLIDASKEKARQVEKAKRNGPLPTDAKKVLILSEKTVQFLSLGNQHRPTDLHLFIVAGRKELPRTSPAGNPTKIVEIKK